MDPNHSGVIDVIQYHNTLALEVLKLDSQGHLAQASGDSVGHPATASVSSGFPSSPSLSTSTSASTTMTQENLKCAGAMISTGDRKIYIADCHKGELENRLRHWVIFKVLSGAFLVAAGITGFLYLMSHPG